MGLTYFFDQLIWDKFADCQSFKIREPQIKLRSYLLIILVTEKNFWNSRLKAENLQNFWDHWNNLFKQWQVRRILVTECFFILFLEVSPILSLFMFLSLVAHREIFFPTHEFATQWGKPKIHTTFLLSGGIRHSLIFIIDKNWA